MPGYLWVRLTDKPTKYLGIDFGKLQNKREFFQHLVDKFNTNEVLLVVGHDQGALKLQLKSWEALTQPKQWGVVGIRRLGLMNETLLGKQAWRIITKPNLFMPRIMRQKYCRRKGFTNLTQKPHDSGHLEGHFARQRILCKGLRSSNMGLSQYHLQKWQIGNWKKCLYK